MNRNEYNTSVREYSDNLFRFCLSTTGNVQDAEDLVQLAFEKMWNEKDQIKLETVKSWLFSVAHRKMIDNYRRKKTEAKILKLSNDKSSTDLNYEDKDLIHKSLEYLDSRQKQLILLRDYEGYAYDEIAKITELSLSQVKVYIFRARKKLRNIISTLERAQAE